MTTIRRRPTDAEYAAYDGMHCRELWRQTPDNWRCPSCSRNKRELLRWGRRAGSNAQRYGAVGWKCGLHNHHDHAADDGMPLRFNETLICGGCNWADARAKKLVGAPAWFSFSPAELRIFVKAEPNGPVVLNVETARAIFLRHVNDRAMHRDG